LETYQAGDLSGKFGKLKPQNGGTTGFRITDPTSKLDLLLLFFITYTSYILDFEDVM